MAECNAEFAPDKRIEFRMGIHLGDMVALKTIAAWKAYNEAQHGTPRNVEMHERMYDRLRKAGMPEGELKTN